MMALEGTSQGATCTASLSRVMGFGRVLLLHGVQDEIDRNLRRKEPKRAALWLQIALSKRSLSLPRRAKHGAEDTGRQTAVAGGDASGLQGVGVKTVARWDLCTS